MWESAFYNSGVSLAAFCAGSVLIPDFGFRLIFPAILPQLSIRLAPSAVRIRENYPALMLWCRRWRGWLLRRSIPHTPRDEYPKYKPQNDVDYQLEPQNAPRRIPASYGVERSAGT
jgi:hypothetical protein